MLLVAVPVFGQAPQTPCTPYSVTTTDTATSSRSWRCASDGQAWTEILPLVSGQNIKTINNTSLLGSGNIDISAGGIPSGAILIIVSGSCPTGYTEETSLNGKTLLGTLAANGNVGGTGGSDTITPAGTISAINQVINHTHTVSITDPGHTHVERIINSGTAGTVGVQGASAASNANASNSPTASGTTGITASTANPAGGVASITPTFTGTQFDNRSAFVRVIFCKKD